MKNGRDRISLVLYLTYLILLVVSAGLLARIFYLEVFWSPNENIERRLSSRVTKVVLEPERGNILAEDGRLLAMSYPKYQLHMDPSANRKSYANLKDTLKGRRLEKAWEKAAFELSEVLEREWPRKDGWYSTIINLRRQDKTYLKLGKPIEKDKYNEIMAVALDSTGKSRCGVYSEKIPTRRYPNGGLARRTIGFVRDASIGLSNNYVGLDGKFDYELHGSPGYFYTKYTDEGPVRDYDSLYVKAVDGNDIRTTINLDYQEIADLSLRRNIGDDMNLEGGCCVIMDVHSGAIKAMVNLKRDGKGNLAEIENLAIGRRGEPGSVFKIVTLMTVLSDGKIKSLDDRIPTNGSVIEGYRYEIDKHIVRDWEQKYHQYTVPIIYGAQVSSNYIFRYLAIKHYASDPSAFIDRLYMYKLGESFDFDIDGLKTPSLPDPKSRMWNKSDLGQVAMGYNVAVTPLHLITFYNAIANKGRMMKPYLVEDIEKDGRIVRRLGPSVLNSAICSKAVADTLTRALESVTTKHGSGWRLEQAKCRVAGKTGTAYVHLDGIGYRDAAGKRKCQGTFVGYFPSDDPQYSIICTIYSRLSGEDYFGGTIPAQTVREIVDKIYYIDPYWNETL